MKSRPWMLPRRRSLPYARTILRGIRWNIASQINHRFYRYKLANHRRSLRPVRKQRQPQRYAGPPPQSENHLEAIPEILPYHLPTNQERLSRSSATRSTRQKKKAGQEINPTMTVSNRTLLSQIAFQKIALPAQLSLSGEMLWGVASLERSVKLFFARLHVLQPLRSLRSRMLARQAWQRRDGAHYSGVGIGADG